MRLCYEFASFTGLFKCNKSIVDIVADSIYNHAENHYDILSRLLHREERNLYLAEICHFKQIPTHSHLESETDEKPHCEEGSLFLFTFVLNTQLRFHTKLLISPRI